MGELRSTSMLPERYDSGIASDSDQETTDGSLDNIRNEEAEISRMLAKWVISVMTQKKPSPIPSKIEKYAPNLMKVIERLLSSNENTFKRMVKQLNIGNIQSSKSCLNKVAEELFSDNVCNWGRIVTLYAFAGEVAKSLQPDFGDKVNDEVADELSRFVNQRLSQWINQQKGWDSMNEFFGEENSKESKMPKVLYALFGLGALAATLAMR